MSAARLSPTANLLRNSKLFALPPALSLPPARPTAEPTASSDTSTTLYPIKSALETPTSSLHVGDWGLKRALPLKSTLNTGTPTIRLRKDIDTEAHIADFESAADHVITLQKWQDVNPQVTNTPKWNQGAKSGDRRTFSVFHPAFDNTINIGSSSSLIDSQVPQRPPHLQQALEQMQADVKAEKEAQGLNVPEVRSEPLAPRLNKKRWRYGGPWLAGMSNLEFDTFIKDVTSGRGLREFDGFLMRKDYLQTLARKIEEPKTALKTATARVEEARHERIRLQYQHDGLPPEEGERRSQDPTEPGLVELRKAAETAREAEGMLLKAIERLEVAGKEEMHGKLLKAFQRHLHDVQIAADDHSKKPARQKAIKHSLQGDAVYQQHLLSLKKKLRGNREALAAVVAEFLDLPDGPVRPPIMISKTEGGDWEYARNTAATSHYRETGPPRTHPSAGFSYTRSTQYARNDPKAGPAYPSDVLPARLLKESPPADGSGDRKPQQKIGVGGLVARPVTYGTRSNSSTEQWRPMPGGPKMVVKLLDTTVQQDGAIEVGVVRDREFALDEDNMPYNKQDWERELRAQRTMPQAPERLEQLDRPLTGRGRYRKAEPLNRPGQELDQDASEILDAMKATFYKGEK